MFLENFEDNFKVLPDAICSLYHNLLYLVFTTFILGWSWISIACLNLSDSIFTMVMNLIVFNLRTY